VRLCEFETSSRRESWGLYLFAWAKYKRGDIPTSGEYDYISKRVHAKFPTAELVKMRRTTIADKDGGNSTLVWWEFTWFVDERKAKQ